MKGSTSARKTDDGLEVRCACGETLTLPKDGGERRCRCGQTHRYDGKQLLSTPPGPAYPGPGIGSPNLRPVRRDPRVQAPPRGQVKPQ